jgi:hypothetical protein
MYIIIIIIFTSARSGGNFLKMFRKMVQARTLLIVVKGHGELHDKRKENNILACNNFIIFYT